MLNLIEEWLTDTFVATLGRNDPAAVQQSICAAENVATLIKSDFLRKYDTKDLQDSQRLRSAIFCDAPFQATFLYRISHAIFLKCPEDPLLTALAYVMRSRTAIEIYYSAHIGEGMRIMHGAGIVVGPRHRIGKNVSIYQGVTFGQRRQNSPHEYVTVGDDCVFFAGSKVLGQLRIGDGVCLAANAVLLQDAESHSTYAGIPACKVNKLP